jgi:hypothetical protein
MKDYNENVYPANDQTQDINISVSMSALQLVDRPTIAIVCYQIVSFLEVYYLVEWIH